MFQIVWNCAEMWVRGIYIKNSRRTEVLCWFRLLFPYYLDVTPFLETLEKMKAFYTKPGIDIFKDAVSLPGVSMQYTLRGTLRGRDPPELYAPTGEAYEMMKGAVVGGPSLVFTRKHIAGQTRIRSHKYDLDRTVQRIQDVDANSLYPSTMTKEMPCGKETVVHYEDPAQAANDLIHRLYSKRWFGFAEVDIEVPGICEKRSKSSHPSS